jgi:hypothetical protein
VSEEWARGGILLFNIEIFIKKCKNDNFESF